MTTQQLSFNFLNAVDAATTARHAGKDKNTTPGADLKPRYTYAKDGTLISLSHKASTVDWEAMANEAQDALEAKERES